MSEEFDREKQNNVDISSSSASDDRETHHAYENGMRVAHNPYQDEKPQEDIETDGNEDSEQEAVAATPKKKKKMKTVDKVIMIIAIIVFLISLGVILKTVYDITLNKKQTEDIAGLVSDSVEETREYGDDGILEKYRSAYNANNDLVGWIVVPNTSINHPVVQGKNNEYYLRRSFYGDYQKRGTVFMDYRDHAKPLCKNTILYGHNFLDSTMFADLEKYKDIEFYKTSPVIQFDTIYEKHKWKIVGVFLTNADDKDDNGYTFNYIYPFMTNDNFEAFMDEVKVRSLYFTNVDVNKNDKILTLSTCTRDMDIKGNGETNARFVVIARLVRDGESETVDVSKTVKNDNPRYPQIWYDAHGLSNPYVYADRWFPEGVEY